MKIINSHNFSLKNDIHSTIKDLIHLYHQDLLSLESQINSFLSSLKSQNLIDDWHFMADPNSIDLSFIIEVFDINGYPMEFFFSLP